MDALILAGGLGTRLRSVVADRAKPVAEVGDRPFVLWMMKHLARTGRISRFVLCTGHLSATVQIRLGGALDGIPVVYSEEDRPLGTGGALRQALRTYGSRGNVVALNGDSYLGLNLSAMLARFDSRQTDFMLALARVPSTARYGRVELSGGRIIQFREKGVDGAGWINAGVYLLSPAGCRQLRDAPEVCSLEGDVLPSAMAGGRLRGYRSRARFIDIGVPADYALAQRIFARVR